VAKTACPVNKTAFENVILSSTTTVRRVKETKNDFSSMAK
jgi:hypothetical protein